MKKKLLLFAIPLLSLLPFPIFAASKPPSGIILYEKPDEKSRTVETVAPGTALLPIISEKNWTKVGDTKTGNVGWVSNDTLKQYGVGATKTVTQSYSTPQGQAIQVLQYNSQQLDQKQVDELMKNWKTTQENLNRSFNQMMNQSLYNLNQFLQEFNREQAQRPLTSPQSQPIIIVPNTPVPQPQNSTIAPALPPSDIRSPN